MVLRGCGVQDRIKKMFPNIESNSKNDFHIVEDY
jgi:hypothetical protein